MIFIAVVLCAPAMVRAQHESRGTINTPTSVSDLPTTQTTTVATPPPMVLAETRKIAFLPPISLDETVGLIDKVISELPRTNDAEARAAVPVETLRRMLRSCVNYLHYRDDLQNSLADYEWIDLGSQKVENAPGRADHDTIVYDPPIQRISALSVIVESGDIRVHSLRVIDEKESTRQFFNLDEKPALLRHQLPRRQVFQLWRRSTISRIEISCSRVNEKDPAIPKLTIYGGVSDQREYLKTAQFQIELASDRIGNGVFDRARSSLVDSKETIDEYTRKTVE
ncbi:hypothetical protein IT570_12095 [Candidatus Sumerlaeota bacterium]|nr:hypothetical protein [Candidatus Sumerlaeota bacterium]